MGVFETVLGKQGWPGGVSLATSGDVPAANSATTAINAVLTLAEGGQAFPAKRRGFTPMLTTVSNHVLDMFSFTKGSSGVNINLAIKNSSDSNIYWYGGVGVLALTPQTITGADSQRFDFTVGGDRCFMANGLSSAQVLDVNTAYAIGTTTPASTPTVVASTVAGSHNGTYSWGVTYFNSATGHESSLASTTATVAPANVKLNWSSIPVSADPQVTGRYLYLKNTATMSQFFRVATIADNTTTTATTSVADTLLIITSPTASSNNPPLSTMKYLAYHQGRLFASDGISLYWSAIDDLESFSPINVDAVGANDGQLITGLRSSHGVLVIFKSSSFYVLQGIDPNTWTITLQDGDTGCAAFRTICFGAGWLWWWSAKGLVRWNGGGTADLIGLRTYGPLVDISLNNVSSLACGTYHAEANRILMAVPVAAATSESNALVSNACAWIIPWNALTGQLEARYWDPVSVTAMSRMAAVYAGGNVHYLYVACASGQIYTYSDQTFVSPVTAATANDGAPSGTRSGTFTQSGTTLSSIVGSGFSTAVAGLAGCRVTVFDTSGGYRRADILGNTTTALTIAPTIAGLVDGSVYSYVVAGPNFEWETSWVDGKNPWLKKRFEFALVGMKNPSISSHTQLITDFDYSNLNDGSATKRRINTLTTSSETSWDNGNDWNAVRTTTRQHRLARTGKVWSMRVVNRYPDEPVGVVYLGANGTTETEKR